MYGTVRRFLTIILILVMVLSNTVQTQAASSQWTQTDWSGGVGSSTSTQYASVSQISTSTAGQISLSQRSDWYNSIWTYRKTLTIDETKVSGSTDLTNFQVLISMTDSDLASKAQSDADDILFTSSDGTTKLDHEIESYDSATGTLIAWVRVPTLDYNDNTILYMYYGNASASSQQNPTGVWSAEYEGVWHLKEDPTVSSNCTGGAGTLEVCDSTANNNDADAFGDTGGMMTVDDSVTAKIGKGIRVNADNDYVQIGNLPDTLGVSKLTMSVWMKRQDASSVVEFGKEQASADAVSIQAYSNSTLYFELSSNPDFDYGTVANSSTDWIHTVMVFDGTQTGNDNRLKGYVNGVLQTLSFTSNIDATTTTDTGTFYLGHDGFGTGSRGVFDEARIYLGTRTDEWIATEYANQNDPTTFYTVGSEQQQYQTSGTLTSNIFDSGSTQTTWTTLSYSGTSGTGTIAVKARSGNAADLSDATAFGSCSAITSGDNASTGSCVENNERYVQYQISLTGDGQTTPTFQDITLAYSTPDVATPTPAPVVVHITPRPPTCGMPSPEAAPNIFNTIPSSNSVNLVWSDTSTLLDYYALEFGYKSGVYNFGAHNIGGKDLRQFTIQYLNPSTTYYVRVRNGNGCAVGKWSDEKKITTKRRGAQSASQSILVNPTATPDVQGTSTSNTPLPVSDEGSRTLVKGSTYSDKQIELLFFISLFLYSRFALRRKNDTN